MADEAAQETTSAAGGLSEVLAKLQGVLNPAVVEKYSAAVQALNDAQDRAAAAVQALNDAQDRAAAAQKAAADAAYAATLTYAETADKVAAQEKAASTAKAAGKAEAGVDKAKQNVDKAEAGVAAAKQNVDKAAPSAAGGLSEALKLASGGIGAATSGISSALGSAGGSFQAIGGAIGNVSQMLSGVLGPAGAAVGQALGQAVGKIGEFINAVQPFVEALAPGTILLFNNALKNLQATVGVAFEPIFQVLTGLFQRVGGIIIPLMEQLRPIIQQVSETFVSLLLPIVKLIVVMFQAWMPFIEQSADLFNTLVQLLQPIISVYSAMYQVLGVLLEITVALYQPFVILAEIVGVLAEGLAEAIDAVMIIFKALVDQVKAFLPSFNIKDILSSLAKVIRDVISNFLILIGTLFKFFGLDAALASLIDSTKPKTGAVAAAANSSIGSVESVAKDVAQASAIAAGGGETEKEKGLGDVVKELEKIQAQGPSSLTLLLAKIDQVITVLQNPKKAIPGYSYISKLDAIANTATFGFAGWYAKKVGLGDAGPDEGQQ